MHAPNNNAAPVRSAVQQDARQRLSKSFKQGAREWSVQLRPGRLAEHRELLVNCRQRCAQASGIHAKSVQVMQQGLAQVHVDDLGITSAPIP